MRLTDFAHPADEIEFKLTIRPWQVSDARESVRVSLKVELSAAAKDDRVIGEDAQWAAPL